MNNQTCNHAERDPAAGSVLDPSNRAATTTAASEMSESNWPQKSEGKIPIGILLNPSGKIPIDSLLNPSGKIPIYSLLNPLNGSTLQDELRNGGSYNPDHASDDIPKDTRHPGLPSSAMEDSFVHPNLVGITGNQTSTSQHFLALFSNDTVLKAHETAAYAGPPTAYSDVCSGKVSTYWHYCLCKQGIHEDMQTELSSDVLKTNRFSIYYCTLCNFFSFEKGNLKRHEMLEHCDDDPPKFQCIYGCGHVARSRSNREVHEIFCHKAPKPF